MHNMGQSTPPTDSMDKYCYVAILADIEGCLYGRLSQSDRI